MSQGKQHEAGASERARRATGEASALSALVGTGRWSARRKVSVVIEWLKGESLEGLSRRHGVTAAKLSQLYVVKPIRTTAAASQERLPAVVPRGAASSDALSVVLVTFAA